jgi:hypothetical protein
LSLLNWSFISGRNIIVAILIVSSDLGSFGCLLSMCINLEALAIRKLLMLTHRDPICDPKLD